MFCFQYTVHTRVVRVVRSQNSFVLFVVYIRAFARVVRSQNSFGSRESLTYELTLVGVVVGACCHCCRDGVFGVDIRTYRGLIATYR